MDILLKPVGQFFVAFNGQSELIFFALAGCGYLYFGIFADPSVSGGNIGTDGME
jgi:hypothetical protein